MPVYRAPGKINFSSKSDSISPILDLVGSKDNLLTIEAVAGQTYYAEFHVGDTFGPKLILVNQEIGAQRIQKCHLENYAFGLIAKGMSCPRPEMGPITAPVLVVAFITDAMALPG